MLLQCLKSSDGSVDMVLAILILKQIVVARILCLALPAPLIMLSIGQTKEGSVDQLIQSGPEVLSPLLTVGVLEDVAVIDGIGGMPVQSTKFIEVEAICIPSGVAILLQICQGPLLAQVLLLLSCIFTSLRKMKSYSSSRSCPKSRAYNSLSLCYS